MASKVVWNLPEAHDATDIYLFNSFTRKKIIKRARQNYLMAEYRKNKPQLNQLLKDCSEALQLVSERKQKEADVDKAQMFDRMVARLTSRIDHLEKAMERKDKQQIVDAIENLLDDSSDLLSDWLDVKIGHEVTDNSIFSVLPKHWEEEFHRDMKALNVQPPDVLTRVWEYMDEIIAYVSKIIDNGFAYESHGSVYFDTAKFSTSDDHFYAKLVPEAVGDEKALAEGEGVLSTSADRVSEKRNSNDFALWKCSKPGEPSWQSPWGKGRPGWHIECSVMASSILGSRFDIHTGGYDLKFPHHDNEIAQAEAYFGSNEWVRYFLHSGHLTIAGCKMSKSLKNFVTIKDALNEHSSRQLRLAFLLHSWKDTLDYSPQTMVVAVQFEKYVNEFFLNVKDAVRSSTRDPISNMFHKWTSHETDLNDFFYQKRRAVHLALCDNIDTRSALEHVRELIGRVNVYLQEKRSLRLPFANILLRNIAQYVMQLLKVFGAIDDDEMIGFPQQSVEQESSHENIVMPYLDVFATFREDVRRLSRGNFPVAKLLQLCDDVRDRVLPDLGVRLEDHEGLPPVIKLVDREILMKERDAKLKMELDKQAAKEKQRQEVMAKQAEKEAMRRIPAHELFLKETDKYSKFDATGFPTHDTTGKELSNSQKKKLRKLFDRQQRIHAEYLASCDAAAMDIGGLQLKDVDGAGLKKQS